MSDQLVFGAGGDGRRPRPPVNRRTVVLAGITAIVVVVVAAIGIGAFLVVHALTQGSGPQPAEVLPSTTFAYASLDTDPTDGEKLDLIKTALKFPGISHHLSLTSSGGGTDLRQKIVEGLLKDDNPCRLSWDADFKPWMGNKFAVAGVGGAGSPQPVAVTAVSNPSAAQAALQKLQACAADPGRTKIAFQVKGSWALIAASASVLDQIASATAQGTLAATADFRSREAHAGGDGFFHVYAAPSAGDELAKALETYRDDLTSLTEEPAPAIGCSSSSDDGDDFCAGTGPLEAEGLLGGFCPGIAGTPDSTLKSYETSLKHFGGLAATARFRSGGLELASAYTVSGTAPTWSAQAGHAVGALPADTTAAFSVSVPSNSWERILANIAATCGGGTDTSSIDTQLSDLTGLSFPGDIDALLGRSMVLSLGQVTIDLADRIETLPDDASSSQVLGVFQQAPLALSITGDPTAIGTALDHLEARLPDSPDTKAWLAHDTEGSTVVIGPDPDYRTTVTAGGLSGSKSFKEVVPHAAQATSVLYVDLDRLDPVIEKEMTSGGDQADFDNWVKPFQAFGYSTWVDGNTVHGFVRLSTD